MLIPHGGWRRMTVLAVGLIAILGLSTSKSFSTSPAAPILISQTPLTVTIPAHPQIVFALGNSQSMDGDLSGAVMTGSGSLAGTIGVDAATQLGASSSPVNYAVPGGFTPPINPGSAGQAPYTVSVSGTLVDNSASRLNVAKAGISAILNSFMGYADFALMDYQTADLGEYATWVYYASPPAGFSFTSTTPQTFTGTASVSGTDSTMTVTAVTSGALTVGSLITGAGVPVNTIVMAFGTGTGGVGTYTVSTSADWSSTTISAGSDYVQNPCYNYATLDTDTTDAYWQSCAALEADFGSASNIGSDQYMIISNSSDDPSINDVFYAQAGYQPPICTDGVPSPLNPYTSFGISNYETGAVTEFYGVQWGAAGYTWSCAPGMQPTNAGYVPYSPQIMQVMRGFGYDATTISATAGSLLVPMQTAGSAPTAATVATAISAFTPYLQPETADPSTTEVKSVAEQSPIAAIVQSAAQYLSTTETGGNCAPAQYIVLVTDGLPTKDLSGNSWPPLGSQAAAGYGVTPTSSTIVINSDGYSFSTSDQAVKDAITAIQNAYKNYHIKTYVIGLGAGVDRANNPLAADTLTWMAQAGQTGSYFKADSPADVTADMQVILSQILNAVRSSASATVNTTALNSTSMAFQPSFNTSDVNQDWTGDLRAYPLDPGTGAVETSMLAWSTQAQLDSQASANGWSNRIIATWDPVANAATPFEWSGGTPSQGIAVSTQLGQDLESNTADPSGQDALDYLRGDQALSVAQGGAYRTRTHVLGDIVDSSPVYVSGALGPYETASYYAFEKKYPSCAPTVSPCRQAVLYVGANDGMLHAISATTGQELFAYIPRGVYPNLINLTNPYYNQNHQFFADGSPQVGDVQFASNDKWRTILVSGERGGGNSVFALDVTDPSGISSETTLAQHVLWDFTDANMGLTYSAPVIAQTAYGATANHLGFTVFFGNGYNSASEKPYLYAVNPETGNLLTGMPIDLCAKVPTACNVAQANGLSSVNVVSSLGGTGTAATTVYAGDLQGNVWRVDIHDPDPANWSVTLLFKALDPSNNPQPITTTPAVSLNPEFPRLSGTMVYVGTGQMLGTSDLSSTQIQTMYGIYDAGNGVTVQRSDLVNQPLTESLVSGYTLRFVSGTQVDLTAHDGWLVDFDVVSGGVQTDVGERIVSDPRLIGGALTVISVKPTAPTTTTSMVTPSLRSHAMLAATKHTPEPPPGQPSTIVARPAAALDSVVYVTQGPQLAAADFRGAPSTLSMDGVYHPSQSTARLTPVGLGVGPPPTLQSIAVSPSAPVITAGQTVEFTAIGTYSDGSTKNLTTSVTWTSSDTGVATIGSTGLASSTTAGVTGITASLGSISGSASLTVNAVVVTPPPTLESITVEPSNPQVGVGSTQQFTAIGTYSDGSMLNITGTVTWTSATTSVATISAGGLANALALGSSLITATQGTISGSTTLTVVPPVVVTPPTLDSITVTPSSATIHIGQTQQYTAIATYSDGSTQNVTSTATWTSGTTTVATIGAGGLATGGGIGSSVITATLAGISGTASLTVVPLPTLSSITVTPANQTIYVGATQQYTATGKYSDGSTQNLTASVTWTSSAGAVASISSGGLATGITAGATLITATDGSVSGSTGLTVINHPSLLSISVAPPDPSIDVGQTQQFTATGHYSDGSTVNLTTASGISWTSTNTSVATVTLSGGLATGAAIGLTTIQASYGTVSGNALLTVTAAPAPPPPAVCPGGDVSYLMEFNFAGGAFSTPVFNYNGTGAVTSSIVPANGMLLGGVYASGPVYNTYSAGAYGSGGDIGWITLSSTQTVPFAQLGLHQQRYSWWEIR
ncbi:MAG TPA: PilC/PilY family type IV pilus protein [Steroidobacteraceae bacterium]|nr:PilC/PilY family type IV pilus protein [Steroidobacteraceae bacterium]